MVCAMLSIMSANAQKFALIDMEYILKNVPAYERANEQLNQRKLLSIGTHDAEHRTYHY